MSIIASLIGAGAGDTPSIKAFHRWEVSWDAGGATALGKAAKLAIKMPTKMVTNTVRVTSSMRLVTAEIHRIPPAAEGGKESEECIVRVMIPAQGKFKAGMSRMLVMGGDAEGKGDFDDDDDDASVYSVDGSFPALHTDALGSGGWVAGRVEGFSVSESQGGGSSNIPLASEWKTKKELPIDKVNVISNKGRKVLFTVGIGHGTKTIKFENETEANGFLKLMAHLKEGQAKREEERKLAAMMSLNIENENAVIDMLVEIVSCWELPRADVVGGSDPYVKVTMDGKEVHKTKYLSSTTEPVYTIKNGSLFVFSTTIKKLFESRGGLEFTVKDYDAVGGNDTLGTATVPPRKLYDADGERMVIPLAKSATEKGNGGLGYIAIRCRHATEHDMEFMRTLKRGLKNIGEKNPLALSTDGGMGDLKSLMTVNTKMMTDPKATDPTAKVKKHKIRPYPDPARKAETKWMSEPEIQEEAMKRSTNWLDVGTGDLGRIYLEIIGCDGLPNLDSGGAVGNKTDSYVTVVYEDSVMRTDVVADKLSPRWMPWTKRAFILRMMHSSSQVFLGIFDFDTGYDDHDMIGRVKLDLSTFHPYTEYLIHFNIHSTDKWSDRSPQGTITVRLMLEYENERKLILSALSLPQGHVFHVNMQQKKDYYVARYTATGKIGAEKYGMKQINEYVEELLAYKRVLFYMHDGLVKVIFWRGHYAVTICVPRLCPFKDIEELGGRKCTRSVTIKLPFRSLIVFVAAVILVERPRYTLSFILGAIGFIMTGSLNFRRSSPSKWVRCRTFHYYLRVLILGRGISPPQTIKPYDNAEEFKEFEKDIADRATQFEEEAEAARLENLKKQEEYQKEMAEIGEANVDISTKAGGGITGGVSIDPFHALYVQAQTILKQVVLILRFTQNILVWEESYIAFFLTITAYALAFVGLFIPWGFIFEWTMRILVWTFLGPWMKLVDIFWHSHVKFWLEKMKENAEKQQKEAMDLAKMEARTARENAEKLKVMKQVMFGPYISNVPVYKCGRYKDVPLLASEANPIAASKLKEEKAEWSITRVYGQHLEGVMIPSITCKDEGGPGDSVAVPSEGDNGSKPTGEAEPLLDGKQEGTIYV